MLREPLRLAKVHRGVNLIILVVLIVAIVGALGRVLVVVLGVASEGLVALGVKVVLLQDLARVLTAVRITLEGRVSIERVV